MVIIITITEQREFKRGIKKKKRREKQYTRCSHTFTMQSTKKEQRKRNVWIKVCHKTAVGSIQVNRNIQTVEICLNRLI